MLGNIYLKRYQANAIAIKYKRNTITYEQLDKTVKQYSNLLHRLGVTAGERVLLSCPNVPEFIYSYLGVVKNAGIIVPVNQQLTLEEISYFIRDAEARFMLIHPDVLRKLGHTQGALQELLSIKVIVLDEEFQRAVAASSPEVVEKFADEQV